MLALSEERYRQLLVCLLAVIAVLYVVSFDARELWPDEGYRLFLMNGQRNWGDQLQVDHIAPYADVLMGVGVLQYQPMFFLIGNSVFTLICEVSIPTIRLLNILELFLAIAGLLRLVKHWRPAARLFLVFSFATNGFYLMHVMQFREYPLYVAVAIWSSVYYMRLRELAGESLRKVAPAWAVYVLIGIFGYYTHIYFVVLLGAQAVYAFWPQERWKAFAISVYAGLCGVFLGALPWMIWVEKNFPGRSDPGTYSPGVEKTFSYLLTVMVIGFRTMLAAAEPVARGRVQPEWVGSLLDAYAIAVGLAIVALLIYWAKRWRTVDPVAVYALATTLAFLSFQTIWFFWKDPLSTWPRYYIGNYLGVTILLGAAFHTLLTKGTPLRRLVTAGVVVFALAAGLTHVYRYRLNPYLDTPISQDCGFKEVGIKLSGLVRQEDALIYNHPMIGWTLSPNFRTPIREANFFTAQAGYFPKQPRIWLLDTHVEHASMRKSFQAIAAAGYKHAATEKLGCLADAIRFDSTANPPAVSGATLPAPPIWLVEAPVAPAPGADAIVIEAENFQKSNGEAESTVFGPGIGVLKDKQMPAWAEYSISVPRPGRYEARLRLAHSDPRPMSLIVNGTKGTTPIGALQTGGDSTLSQVWVPAGEFDMTAVNTVRIESVGRLPYIDKLAFVPK